MTLNLQEKQWIGKSKIIVFSILSIMVVVITSVFYIWWSSSYSTQYLNCNNFSLFFNPQNKNTDKLHILNFKVNGNVTQEIGAIRFEKAGMDYQSIYITKNFSELKTLVSQYNNCFPLATFYLEINPQADNDLDRCCIFPKLVDNNSRYCRTEQLVRFNLL